MECPIDDHCNELLSVGSDGCLDPDRCSSVSNTGSMEEQRIFLEFCQPSPAHGSRQSVRLLEEPARSGRSLQSSPTHRSPMQDRRRSLALPTKPKEDRRRSLGTPRSRRRSTLAAASRRSSAMPGSRSPTSRRRSSALTGSRSPSGRRRSSAMPGSRSPSGRRLRRDEEGVLDSWADYHQQVSPPAEEGERQRLYSTGGYRCRSFSTSGNSAIFCYQGRVVMPGDESRPTCCLRRVPTHRVRVIGADGVGKSCLIHQLVESEDLCSYQNIVTTPDSSSDTLPELPKTRLILDDEESELVFEETHKTEVTAQDLIETDAFLIVYSMADGESYEFAESILGRLLLLCTILRNQRKSSCGSTTRRCEQDLFRKAIIVVANKDDLNRCKVITIKDGRTLAEHHKSKYATISAFIGHKTNHLLVGTLRQIRLIENVGTRQTKKRPSNLPIIQLPEGDILDPNDQSISSCNWMCGNLYDLTRDFLYSMWNKCFLKSPRQCENLNVL